MPNLETIQKKNDKLTVRFKDKLVPNADLSRSLVSFQANKTQQSYRWFKYKEGFSSSLINYILDETGVKKGKVFDPFAGAGTTLFVAAERGLDAVGIELLPIGQEIITARKSTLNGGATICKNAIERWLLNRPWNQEGDFKAFNHLRITNGAFPEKTEKLLTRFIAEAEGEQSLKIRQLLKFVALCVLEDISYTRKDGQYLRWDKRSGRRQGKKPFDKGHIKSFEEAVIHKLEQVLHDLQGVGQSKLPLFANPESVGLIEVIPGSCLDMLPSLKSDDFDCIITSPPYCNRYDYTRTYALELAMLGVNEDEIKKLRQTMLSCTVENREKNELDKVFHKSVWDKAKAAFDSQECLQDILKYLQQRKDEGELNNNGIVRMVRGYFWEMSLVIFECARTLKAGAPFVMVNDNVRYEGANVPVDLIFSDIAEKAGFEVEKIWVLPTNKGNSSQQMGKWGRTEIRKCVYVWRKAGGKKLKANQPVR